MPFWSASGGAGAHQNSLDRVEAAVGRLTDQVGTFREEFATIKSEQEGQRRWIGNIESDLKAGIETVNQSVGKLSVRMEERDRPKMMFWISAFSFLFVVITSAITVGVFFVQSNIREETGPIRAQLAQLQQQTSNIREIENSANRSAIADARSETDRADINHRLQVDEIELSSLQAKNREEFTSLQAGFTEIETQFKNLIGLIYYLWKIVTGEPFPIVPRETPTPTIRP